MSDNTDELIEFFQSLGNTDWGTGVEYEESAATEICEILGYDLNNVSFHENISQDQDPFIVSAVVNENDSQEPDLVIQAVQYTESSYPKVSEGIDPMIIEDLRAIQELTATNRAVFLTNRAVGGISKEGVLELDLDDLSSSTVLEFCERFSQP